MDIIFPLQIKYSKIKEIEKIGEGLKTKKPSIWKAFAGKNGTDLMDTISTDPCASHCIKNGMIFCFIG